MTVVAPLAAAGDDDAGDRPAPSFLDGLVARLSAEYGLDRADVRDRAEAVLATFASARVQAFVPLLVEKRLRETYRGSARP